MPILSQLRKSENAALGVGGVTYYDTLDSLPITGLTSGDQAFVSATERYYVSDGNGWFNTTLINKNIRWDSGGEPSASYSIVDSATPLIITARAADSDNANFLNQSFGSDSAQFMATVTNDSSVFTFTPKTAAQIGASVAAGDLTDSNGDFIYTFKWSDGLSFVNKAVTITYSPSGFTGTNWNGSRVLFNAGQANSATYSYVDEIEYFDITTLGNSQSFGNVSEIKSKVVAVSSAQRNVIMNGFGHLSTQTPPGSGRNMDEMEYVDFATPANAVSFGLLATGSHDAAAGSNGTRGIIGGGDIATTSPTARMEYITIDTTSNASSFGNMSNARHNLMSTNDDTYLGFLEGYASSNSINNGNTWVTMDTLGNSSSTGDLYPFRHGNGGRGVCSDNTYGVVFGGNASLGGSSWNNEIRYLTIATKSDGSDFGDCLTSLAHNAQAGYAETKRGVSMGGFYNPGTNQIDTIQYITIDTPSNAQNFGTLTTTKDYGYGSSGNAA